MTEGRRQKKVTSNKCKVTSWKTAGLRPVAWSLRLFVACCVLLAAWGAQPAFADPCNIDFSNKYAWNENAGWMNFAASGGGATVLPTELSGYAWCENIGWVKLKGKADDATTYGVISDGFGNLSGYAWGENAGWINFNPSTSQVKIDTNGKFSGYAWSENLGWINFSGTSTNPTPYYVQIASLGTVYDSVTDELIQGANVTLYTATGVIEAGTIQLNPQTSDAAGEYRFDMAPGTYFVTAARDGYEDYTSDTFGVVSQVTWNIPMTPLESKGPENSSQVQYLAIRHTVNRKTATIGDILTYNITVTNISETTDVTGVEVAANLPHDFKYISGTSIINSGLSSDPANKKAPGWSLGTVSKTETETISYRVIVGPDTKTGKKRSNASATGATNGSATDAGPSTAVVDVQEGLFCKRELVMGKVFDDKNGNGVQDEGEKGVPNVSLILDDGKVIITDEHGKFSIPEVSLGVHVIRVDTRILPDGPLTKESTLSEWEKERRQPREVPEELGVQPVGTPEETPSLSTSEAAGGVGTAGAIGEGTGGIDAPDNQSAAGEGVSLSAEEGEKAPEPLIERRTLGGWIKNKLFEKPVESKEFAKPKEFDKAVHRPEIPQVSKFFRVYNTQTTKVNIPIQILTEEEAERQAKRDERETQFLLIALADGQVGYLNAEGNIENLKDGSDEGFEDDLYKDGSVKVYLKGKIKGKYLLTARYDSETDYEDHLFEYINPEKYYPIYGDGSVIYDDTDSQEKFYIKLERADSYSMYANYSTEEFTKTELSKYGRTLHGIKTHIETKDFSDTPPEGKPNVKIDFFGSETRQDKRQDILSGRGVSGPYYLTRSPIIEYTELIRIEVRDQNRRDVILSSQAKTLDLDYEIDYNQGKIVFKEPIPTNDENGDPVYIVVDYEYVPSTRTLDHYVMGARGEVTFGEFGPSELTPKFKLGSQFVTSRQESEKLSIIGVDATCEVLPGINVSGEWAHSDDISNNPGNAWRIETSTRLLDNKVRVQAYTTEIDSDFSNPTNVTETAVQKYGVTAQVKPAQDLSVIVDHYRNRSTVNKTFHRDTKVDAYYEKERYLLSAGYDFREFVDERDLTYDIDTYGLRLQGGFKFTPRLIGSAEYKLEWEDEEGLRRQTINKVSPRVDFRLDEYTSVYARHDYQHEKTKGGDCSYRSNISVLGLKRDMAEGVSSYVEYGFVGGRVETTKMGQNVNVPLSEKLSLSANNSTILSKDKNEENIGYGAKWEPLEDFYVNFLFARNKTAGDQRYDSNSQSVAVEYRPANTRDTVGAKLERRYADGVKEYNLDGNTRFCINDSLYFISRGQYQIERDKPERQTNRLFQRLMGGLAYRPVEHDKLNMLAKYEYSKDKNCSLDSELTNYTKHIGQIEAIYDLTPKIELYSKYALKWVGEDANKVNTHSMTDLMSSRVRYKFTDWFDLAGIYHVTKNRDSDIIKQGAQAEAGVLLLERLRVAAGWNFTDYEDDELAEEDYTAYGPYVNCSFALMEPELEGLPGIRELTQDRVDAIRKRMLRERMREVKEDEKNALNEKFREAEALYEQARYEEAKKLYDEIILKKIQLKLDVRVRIDSKLDQEKEIAALFEEAEALYGEGKYHEAKGLYEQVMKRCR